MKHWVRVHGTGTGRMEASTDLCAWGDPGAVRAVSELRDEGEAREEIGHEMVPALGREHRPAPALHTLQDPCAADVAPPAATWDEPLPEMVRQPGSVVAVELNGAELGEGVTERVTFRSIRLSLW